MTVGRHRSKTVATWLALLVGSLGWHRLYLHGWGDRWAWLFPIPTLVGLYGVRRALTLGQDDTLSWLLIPLFGLMLAASMLQAIVYGLTADTLWNERFNRASVQHRSGWLTVIGVVLALALGATTLMATLAFSAQRFFEFQIDQSRGTRP